MCLDRDASRRHNAGTRSSLQGASEGLEYLRVQPDLAKKDAPIEVTQLRSADSGETPHNLKMAIGGSAAKVIATVLSNPTSIISSLKEANDPKYNWLGGFLPRQSFRKGLLPQLRN